MTPNEIKSERKRKVIGEKIAGAWKMIHNTLTILVLAYIVWTFANAEIVWKTMRYPEAVRQMQIEVVIKK